MFDEKYMTVNEVARWLSVNPQTIRRMLHANKIKSYRIGEGTKARYRIPMVNVLEWIRNKNEPK